MLRLKGKGRGLRYSKARGVYESLQRLLYAGSWPALLGSLVPGSSRVRAVSHHLAVGGEAHPCRVAFASDLHIGPVTHDAVLERAAELIRAAKPDVLLLGGDFVFLDATPSVLSRLRRWVASIQAPLKFAVLGNHDLWADDAAIAATLEDAGVVMLHNHAAVLPEPFSNISIVGLDDPWTGIPDAAKAFAELPGDGTRIVVCHAPDGVLYAGENSFDIMLCGHTHGGQIASPWGPIVSTAGKLSRSLSDGFHSHGGRSVYVSRGVGNVELPLRLFATPDVLILDVLAEGDTVS